MLILFGILGLDFWDCCLATFAMFLVTFVYFVVNADQNPTVQKGARYWFANHFK